MHEDLLSPDFSNLPPLDSPPMNEGPMSTMDGFVDPTAQLYPMHHLDDMSSVYDPMMHTIDPDQLSNPDGSQYGSEYGGGTPLMSRPNLKRAHDSLDDGLSNYDSAENASVTDQPVHDSPQLDRDDRNLFFSQPSYNVALLDYAYRRVQIHISAQLNGMFFLTDKAITSSPTTPTPNVELTCYRRNLFSITGSISIPRSVQFVMTDQGEQIPIVAQDLVLSATESVEGNPVKIISVPWKTPPAATSVPEDNKPEKEPNMLSLDLMAGSETDPEIAMFPIAWKRLQFRIATANNGRRKELQQHFVVKLKLMATLATGQRMSLAEVTSNNIIVRGRSPRNFSHKREAPTSAGIQKRPKLSHAGSASPVPQPRSDDNVFFDPRQTLSMSPDPFDWRMGHQTGPMTALPPDTFNMGHGVPMYANSSPDLGRRRAPTSAPMAPINLSLADDEPRKPFSPTKKMSRPNAMPHSARAPSFGLSSLTENDETADLLYEYFPLGLDEWHEPVDAVYRPHVVHHIVVPGADGKNVKDRSKLYFR